jgi:hypothetical protein
VIQRGEHPGANVFRSNEPVARRRQARLRQGDGSSAVGCRPAAGARIGDRAVAQFGSALDWGSSGRRFKSCQPDNSETSVSPARMSFRANPGWASLEDHFWDHRWFDCSSRVPQSAVGRVQNALLGARVLVAFGQANLHVKCRDKSRGGHAVFHGDLRVYVDSWRPT